MTRQFALALPLSPDAVLSTYVGAASAKLSDLHDWNIVWGAKGTGRSHLLQALCHGSASQRLSATVNADRIYLSQLEKLAPDVLRNLETYSLICIDDVDHVLGNPEWEEALFHLLNGAKDHQKCIVLSIEKAIPLLNIRLPDLKSRFSAAALIETDSLTDEEKIAALQRRAEHWGFDLPGEVGRFILSRSPRSMVALMDNLKRLELETLRAQRKVTIPFAKQTLRI